MSKTENGTTSVGYPIYDGHGNRAATLTKSGTSFSLTDVRTYDAWGNVRVGAQTGRPRARYCANLGHVQDDESNLIYMRARYYEPSSGRFVSHDLGMHGHNWFAYCAGDPVNCFDSNGRYSVGAALTAFLISLLASALATALTSDPVWGLFICSPVGAIMSGANVAAKALPSWLDRTLMQEVDAIGSTETRVAENSEASNAVVAMAAHAGEIQEALLEITYDAGYGSYEAYMDLMVATGAKGYY